VIAGRLEQLDDGDPREPAQVSAIQETLILVPEGAAVEPCLDAPVLSIGNAGDNDSACVHVAAHAPEQAQGSRRCSKESPNTQQSDGKSERNASSLMDSTSAQMTEAQDAFARSAYSASISMPVYSHPGFSAVYARAKAPLLQPTSTTLLRFFGINRRTSGLWRSWAGVCFIKDSISGISLLTSLVPF